MSRSGSSRMQRPSQLDLNALAFDDRVGVKVVKEPEVGKCGVVSPCFGPSMKASPIKAVLFNERSSSLIWSENARFHVYDKQTGDTHKTPRSRLRWTVKCMVRQVINDENYLWTGHANGEVCLWTEMGKIIGKPFTVAKTGITAMCLVRPNVLWVGGNSGNIRVIKLNTNQKPYEISFHTTVVPGLAPPARTFTQFPWKNPFQGQPSAAIENIPEDFPIALGTEKPNAVLPSGNSFAQVIKGRALHMTPRAHSSNVRCIFARAGRVYSSGGRLRYSIKVWDETEYHLESTFAMNVRGPCVTMAAIPWQATGGSTSSCGSTAGADWRLLTAHESGLTYLWDPSQRPWRPLVEIETRKSPIKSLVVFEKLGLMVTAHKNGSVLVGRMLNHQTRLHALSATGDHDEHQVYPYVPRTLCEEVFPGGLQAAIPGEDCLFMISTRGEIVYWPKEKLNSNFNILKRSSSQRMPVVVNESVMIIDGSQVSLGETIYEGDFARVKRGRFLAKDVIVKEAKDVVGSRNAMDALVKDAHILSTIRHPNIVNIMAVCDNPPFVVMQYYEEGSLYDVLKRCRGNAQVAERFSWDKRLKVAIDVCCGMIFLHCQNPPIVHRDLKSPNVFVDKDFAGASVGDFNLSKDTGPTHISGAVRPSNPMWLAPEVAKGDADFSIATDIYAFGIIMWELLTARTPWDHLKTSPGIRRDILFGRIRYELFDKRRPQMLRDEQGKLMNVSGGSFPQIESYVQLMEDCWAVDVEDRPKTFDAVVSRLEAIRKRLQEGRAASVTTAAHLNRMSDRTKPAATGALEGEEGDVKRTFSEPKGLSSSVHNKEKQLQQEPQQQHKGTVMTNNYNNNISRTSIVENIPQSPFDRQSAEEEEEDGDPEAAGGEENAVEFPVSPFN